MYELICKKESLETTVLHDGELVSGFTSIELSYSGEFGGPKAKLIFPTWVEDCNSDLKFELNVHEYSLAGTSQQFAIMFHLASGAWLPLDDVQQYQFRHVTGQPPSLTLLIQ